MVYTPQQSTSPQQTDWMELPVLLDPVLLRTAREIYRVFYTVHPHYSKRPVGVVINPQTQRGQLVFAQKPILLPHEAFIPLSQLESEMY